MSRTRIDVDNWAIVSEPDCWVVARITTNKKTGRERLRGMHYFADLAQAGKHILTEAPKYGLSGEGRLAVGHLIKAQLELFKALEKSFSGLTSPQKGP